MSDNKIDKIDIVEQKKYIKQYLFRLGYCSCYGLLKELDDPWTSNIIYQLLKYNKLILEDTKEGETKENSLHNKCTLLFYSIYYYAKYAKDCDNYSDKDNDKRLFYLKQACALKYPLALRSLGRYYESENEIENKHNNNIGVDNNNKISIKLYTEAVELGCQCAVSCLIDYNRNYSHVTEQEIFMLQEASESNLKSETRSQLQSCDYAKYLLGIMYLYGNKYIFKDHDKGLQLIESISRTNLYANTWLLFYYYSTNQTEKANQLYREFSKEYGSINDVNVNTNSIIGKQLYYIGSHYEHGNFGFPKDARLCQLGLEKAWEFGDRTSHALGLYYQCGMYGAKKDIEKAKKVYQEIIKERENKNIDQCIYFNLGCLCYEQGEYDNAKKYYELVTDKKCPKYAEAMNNLGSWLFVHGDNKSNNENIKNVLKLLIKSGDGGNIIATENIDKVFKTTLLVDEKKKDVFILELIRDLLVLQDNINVLQSKYNDLENRYYSEESFQTKPPGGL